MIFHDKFVETNNILKAEFERLIKLAIANQRNPNDLWLVVQNAGLKADFAKQTNLPTPYWIRGDASELSENTHMEFIEKYRNSYISNYNLSEYLSALVYDERKAQHIKHLKEEEEASVQIEMLIYLKFWEADLTIKKLYQFVRVLRGENYDWDFSIPNDSSSERHKIIREGIRDYLKDISPILYNLLKGTYKTQIRNAIAHSNYGILNRQIGLNNFSDIPNKYSPLKILSFEMWIEIFHNTLALHNQYIRMNNEINEYYGNTVAKNHILKIEFPNPTGYVFAVDFEYDPIFGSWA